jgi:uncharacterized protein YbjT (DUF2867 family)
MGASAADCEQAAARVLLTGATGYVGGRLLRTLEESGRPVRCMVRRPEALSGRAAEQTEIVYGDVLEPDSLREALAGVTAAYYLDLIFEGMLRRIERAAIASGRGSVPRLAGAGRTARPGYWLKLPAALQHGTGLPESMKRSFNRALFSRVTQ